jgi:serine phosphatase RsbU (regulator of sigma subunit)
MGSDGLPDQNNRSRKRLGENRLVELLEQMRKLTFEAQKQNIETVLNEHMEGTSQRDDMLWVGFEV